MAKRKAAAPEQSDAQREVTVQIELLRAVSGEGFSFAQGARPHCKPKLAKMLVDRGYAVAVASPE